MCADIYTKAFSDPGKWTAACQLINIVNPETVMELLQSPRHKDDEAAMLEAEAERRLAGLALAPDAGARGADRRAAGRARLGAQQPATGDEHGDRLGAGAGTDSEPGTPGRTATTRPA